MDLSKKGGFLKEEIIKSKERVKEFAEVYTPENIVCDMLDLIPKSDFGIHTTFLEPSCGNGNFIEKILERKFKLCKSKHDVLYSLGTVYGIDIQPDNVEECKERIEKMMLRFGGEVAETYNTNKDLVHTILDLNIVEGDFLTLDVKDIVLVDWEFYKTRKKGDKKYSCKQISLFGLCKKEENKAPVTNKTLKENPNQGKLF